MVDLSPVRIKALIALSDFTQIVFLASREVPPASIASVFVLNLHTALLPCKAW
jgi:hypothetical protein